MLSDEMAAAVRDQVDAILSARGGMKFGVEQADMLNSLDSQVNAILQDRSLGRIMNGPLWLSGTSVLNGTITAGKLEVTELSAVSASAVSFNLTGTLTAAASFPAAAARVTVNSSGLWGYSSAIATTFKLNVDGSGEIGTGANKIVWTTGGAVTVPVATIGSLTIAAVGGGIVGGSYQTATTGAHINFSSVGIEAYNATSEIAANRTFQLLASTGAMTATGSFTVQSAATGARVVISNAGGIEGFNSSNVSTFLLNTTGAGRLGVSGSGLSWDAAGAVSVNGSLLVATSVANGALAGGITAGKLSVTTLAAITADMGTITAGTISASRVIAGTFINGGTGTVALGAADLSVASTGKIKFGTSGGDYLANDILHFEVGAFDEATIEIKNGSGEYIGQITGFGGTSASGVRMTGWNTVTAGGSDIQSQAGTTDGASGVVLGANKTTGALGAQYSLLANGAHSWIVDNGAVAMTLARTNRALTLFGYLYPGSGSGSQTTRYIADDGTYMTINGGDLSIASGYRLNLVSPTTGGSASNWSSFTSTDIPDKAAGWFNMRIAGTLYRVPFYANG